MDRMKKRSKRLGEKGRKAKRRHLSDENVWKQNEMCKKEQRLKQKSIFSLKKAKLKHYTC